MRKYFPDDGKFAVVIQQAFRDPSDYRGGYMTPSNGYYNVQIDMHNYHAFGSYWNGLAADPSGWATNLAASCDYVNYVGAQDLTFFTGEWSLAVCDCQKYLAGGYANPYIPPDAAESTCEYYNNDFPNYPPEQKQFMKDYMSAQMDAYEKANGGWFFWTAKTERHCAVEWDYLFLLRNGIAPSNACTRQPYCQFP